MELPEPPGHPRPLSTIEAIRNAKELGALKSFPGIIELNLQQGQDVRAMTVGWAMFGPYEPAENYVPFLRMVDRLLQRVDGALSALGAA